MESLAGGQSEMHLTALNVHEAIRDHLKSEDFEVLSYERADSGDVSIGFLSSTDKECIRYKYNGEEGALHLFIKVLPRSAYHKKNVLELGGFHREPLLYNAIFKEYYHQIVGNTIPKCYIAKSDDIVVLEDMSKKGFRNLDLYEYFDLEHCEKALEAIAKFHSLSFITERNEKRKMTELAPVIKTEVIMSKTENHVGRKAILVGVRALRSIAEEHLTEYPEEVRVRAFDFMENLFDEMKSSKLYPNVLSHSDMWGNNVMFRYGEGGDVQEACVLDFQLSTYKAPAHDILLFLNNCTSRVFRADHEEHLMRHYYRSLAGHLASSGQDVEEVLTWEDFEGMQEEVLPVALAQAPLFLHFVMIPSDVMKEVMVSDARFRVFFEVDRTEWVVEAMNNEKYRTRILESVMNLLDYFLDH